MSTAASLKRYVPGIDGHRQLVADRQIGIRRIDLPLLSAQHRFAHVVEDRKADREVELLLHRLGIDFRGENQLDLVRRGIAERIGRQPHRQLGVRRRRSQHASHHHVARPVVRRQLACTAPAGAPAPARSCGPPSRGSDAAGRRGRARRLDAEHVMRRQSRASGARRRTRGFVTTRNSDPRDRAASVSRPASRRSRSCDSVSDRRACDALPTTCANIITLTLTRASAASVASADVSPLRPFEHQPLRQDDHRLRALDVAQVPQQRGKSRDRLPTSAA